MLTIIPDVVVAYDSFQAGFYRLGCLNQPLFIYILKVKGKGGGQALMKAKGKGIIKCAHWRKIFTHNFCMFPKKNKLKVHFKAQLLFGILLQ